MGITPLAPMAVTRRMTMNKPGVTASAVTAVRTMKATSEPKMTGPRPRRSESGPHTKVAIP